MEQNMIVNTKNLTEALKVVSTAIYKRTKIPILKCVILSPEGFVKATDMDVYVQKNISLQKPFDREICFDPSNVLEVMHRSKAKETSLELKECGEKVVIKCGDMKTEIDLLCSADFPPTPSVDGDMQTVDMFEFKRSLKECYSATSNEETRYYLQGVYIHSDEGRMVFAGTNDHQLRAIRTNIPLPEDIGIMPKKAVNIFEKTTPQSSAFKKVGYRVSADRNILSLSFEEVEIRTKLIDGTFPDYKRVIPDVKSFEKAAFNISELIAVAKGAKGTLVFEVDGNDCTIKKSGDFGKFETKIKCVSEKSFTLGLNSTYLMQSIAGRSGEVSLMYGLKENESTVGEPVVVFSEYMTDIIMPMRHW